MLGWFLLGPVFVQNVVSRIALSSDTLLSWGGWLLDFAVSFVGDFYGMIVLIGCWVLVPTVYSVDVVAFVLKLMLGNSPVSVRTFLLCSTTIWAIVLFPQLALWRWLLLTHPVVFSSKVLYAWGAIRRLSLRVVLGKTRFTSMTSTRISRCFYHATEATDEFDRCLGISVSVSLAMMWSSWKILKRVNPYCPYMVFAMEMVPHLYQIIADLLRWDLLWTLSARPSCSAPADGEDCDLHGICGICLENLCMPCCDDTVNVAGSADASGVEPESSSWGATVRRRLPLGLHRPCPPQGDSLEEEEGPGQIATLRCGHRFCEACIAQSAAVRRSCPACRAALSTGENLMNFWDSVGLQELALCAVGASVMICYLFFVKAEPGHLWSPRIAERLSSAWMTPLLCLPASLFLLCMAGTTLPPP
eukprot:TRINITY_DN121307_c0_g1_i1.p1 TRINITY_DN121307_c0_g1~~TRINITY_DN121307_c0_g1_i1.p1  ORF type:complete len:417 (+),score=47.05 TRINITY_DN121307_c0_g1_i1:38-1288(+)